MKKRLLSIILTISLCLSLLPMSALAAGTKQVIHGIVETSGENAGKIKKNENARECTVVDKTMNTWGTGWYVVEGDVTIDGDLTINAGTVGQAAYLILCDGATLTVNGSVTITGELVIYGQAPNNSGKLCINNLNGNGVAIQSNSSNSKPWIYVEGGNVTVKGGIAENVKLVNGNDTDSYMKCTRNNNEEVLPSEWNGEKFRSFDTLEIAWCGHNDIESTPDSGSTHKNRCKTCGFQWKQSESCNFVSGDGWGKIDATGHYGKCYCGNVAATPTPHNIKITWTDDGLYHTSMCLTCGYAPEGGEKAQHQYNTDTGKCNICDFQPIVTDSTGKLYDDVNEALKAVANGKTVTLETKDNRKEVNANIEFNQTGKNVELQMNEYTIENDGNPTLTVENGTLTVTGDATLVQNGSNEGANPAVRVTGGTLIFNGKLTATGAEGRPAVLVTGGTLKLKAGDVLNGGVSVEGSSTYTSVNELLGEGVAFAKKDGETTNVVNGNVASLSGNVTVVTHTHSYSSTDGKCACGAVCPHSNIDEVTGKCAACKTVFKADVNGTLYSDMKTAINAWLTNGGTMKLYADAGLNAVVFTDAEGKSFTVDLNGYRINSTLYNSTSINLKGANLTIQDSRENLNGAFGPIVADSGTLTLESGYLKGLTVAADSTAKVELKGGKAERISYSKPLYNLMPEGYAMINGTPVDPTKISGGTETYTIIDAQLKNVPTERSGSTAFGSGTIPFALSLKTNDNEVGCMSFKWYCIDSESKAATLLATSEYIDPDKTTDIYTFNPDSKDITINSEGWKGLTVRNTPYDVICVVTGMVSSSNHAQRWETALTGYTLTVTPASIASATVTVDDTNLTYTGKPQSPTVTVKLGDKTLEEGQDKDYTVSYSDNTNAGTATVTVTGKGNYTGEKTANWSIAPAVLTFTANAVSKQYDGTDTANVNVTFRGLQNGETLEAGTDYTVTAKYSSAEVGTNKNITGTVTLNENVKNYVLDVNTISTTGAITKAAAPTVQSGSLTVVNNLAKTYTVDLSALLPELGANCAYGTVSYTLGHVDMSSYYTSGTAKIEDGKLILPINAVNSKTEEKIDTVTVFVNSTNYAQFTLSIDIYTTNKIIPTGTPTLSKDTITYGDALSTITLSGDMNGVEGTFAWADDTVKPNAGNYTATWNFMPTNTDEYQGTSGTVTITVNKATPTGEPKYTAITTSGKKLSDAGLAKNENWPDGTVKWVGADGAELATDTEVKANTAYKWVFTPTSGNYNSIEGSITLYHVSSSGSSSKPSYSVNTPGKTENGAVSLSAKNAVKGSVVTVTVRPDSGYVLDKLTVTDQDGKALAVTDLGGGKFSFVMPAGTVKVEASFAEETKAPAFADVSEGAYYYEAVQWALERGITDGISEDLFGPNQPCTRGQIVTFLWRAAGSPEPKGTSSFADVPTESYYAKAVAWAVENGITTGTASGTFSPDAPCDRAQSVTFLFRALGEKVESGADFSDVPAESYYADAVAWAAENGITTGTSSTTFSPNDTCTRGQIVTFLYRTYQGN